VPSYYSKIVERSFRLAEVFLEIFEGLVVVHRYRHAGSGSALVPATHAAAGFGF
jgi:hypothetical protein